MTDIDQMKIRRLDPTILLVFLALMRHRKATLAAVELGLTQSAISHALKRLRDVLGDELFRRRPHGLEPTAVATALEPGVRAAVEGLSALLAGPQPFDPASAEGLLRVGAFDTELATILPGLIRDLRTEAPGLSIAARSIGRRPALDALEAGDLDLAFGFFWSVGSDFEVTHLYEDGFLVVSRRDDPALTEPLTLERYIELSHILVSPAGDMRGIVDATLERMGKSRRVVAAVPLFFPAFAAVAETGCIATVPRRLAQAHASAFGLVCAEPPLDIRRFPVSVVRHRRNRRNPMHLWLIDRLVRLTADDR